VSGQVQRSLVRRAAAVNSGGLKFSSSHIKAI